MSEEDTSTFRLYLMRLLYLLILVQLGLDVWPAIIKHGGEWDPIKGVAFNFWAALSALAALGLRYPLQMVPLLLLQMLYKFIWLMAVARPQWYNLRSAELTKVMVGGLIVDLIIIPWPYILRQYVRRRGDRWRSVPVRQS